MSVIKLYRVVDTATNKFYRHRYSQFHGGDWVDEGAATIWTKPGGASGALGAVREKARQQRKRNTFKIETATVDAGQLEWR